MINFTVWQDNDLFLGYLNEFPDYLTQASSLTELRENLKDIYQEVTNGEIPFVRRTMSLSV